MGVRERLGRADDAAEKDCLERLPDEVAERKVGPDVVAMEAKLARAFEVFSLAKDARDRLLLFKVRLVELLCW